MKINSILSCLIICLIMLFSPVNESIKAQTTETASVDNLSVAEASPDGSSDVNATNQPSEIPSDGTNPDQTNQVGTSSEPNNNRAPSEKLRLQTTPRPKESGSNPINALVDTTTEGIVLNSLPQVTTQKNPDTLEKIIHWWSANSLKMKLWYLFLAVSIIVFLFGQTSFRKPLLFISLVIFGFYLGNTVNPINSIFSMPVETGIKFIDSLVLVGIPIILSLFVGRFFCGWACPIGAAQEFIHPENLKLRLPSLLDRIFSYIRFLLLFGGVFLSWSAMSNVWNSYDPFQSLFSFKWSLTATSLLLIVLAGSIFIERFFCHYLCPLGAVLTITSRFSLFKMGPDSDACIACGKCSQPGVCSMHMISSINPYTDIPKIESPECIICHRCANVCRYSAIKFSFFTKNRAKLPKTQESGQNLST